MNKPLNAITFFSICLWLGLIISGFAYVLLYSFSPSPNVNVPGNWANSSQIRTQNNRPKLLMFLHPYCPCSLASLHALESLLTRLGQNKPETFLVFFKPGEDIANWKKGALWKEASSIPNIHIVIDKYGTEALRFHANTSGQTLLYSLDGKLLYNGGLTISRGHEGSSPGEERLYQLLIKQPVDKQFAPVFGCSLFKKRIAQ